MRLPSCALAALVVLLAPAFVTAAEPDWPVARGPSREPAPFTYDRAAWKKVPRAFIDDAPACLLYSGTTYRIEPDGTVEATTHEVTRLNGRKGIDDLGEYRSISYEPNYEKLTLHAARVHKTDGTVVEVEPRHVQLRDSGTDYLIYDTSKQLVISFPSLEVGDVVEVKWTVRGKNPEYAGRFFTRYTFGADTDPIVADELRVLLPKDMPFRHAAVGRTDDGKPLAPKVTNHDGNRLYHWRTENRDRLPQDDHRPPREELRLQVACSTFADWTEVGKWKTELRAGCWKCTDDVRRVVAEVTRGLESPTEKARALTYWVRRRVRYVSAGVKHDYTPHPPADVLANRFGDCKDQSQLLAVMLREAGLPVALVTLGTRGDGQVLDEVPSPWGTHAILLVTINGQDHWIDTTASLAKWDFLPPDDRDRVAYVIDEKGLRLTRTPKETPAENRVEQVTEVRVGYDGSTRSVRTAKYEGLAAMNRRDDWLEVPAGERRRLTASELQDANSKSHLSRLAIDEKTLADFEQPVRARITFETAEHFTGEDEPEGSFTDSTLWGPLLGLTVDYDRTVPLDLRSPFESVHRYVVRVPPGRRIVTVPRPFAAESKWATFKRTVISNPDDPRTLTVELHTKMAEPRVAPEDFDAFRDFQEKVQKNYRVYVDMGLATGTADAAALEALTRLAPGDAGAAAALAELYIEAGQEDDARRVLARARHYRADDRKLWELTAEAAESSDDYESAARELVKRFPDEPQYALDLGRSLVVRARHAGAREVLERLADNEKASVRAEAQLLLARSRLAQGEFKPALKHFQRAEKADPAKVHTASALIWKGKIYEGLKKPKEAAKAYRAAADLDSSATEPLECLVRLAWTDGDGPEAMRALRRLAVATDGDARATARVADWYYRLGRDEEAFALAEQARDLANPALAQRVLGLVALRRKQFDKAAFHLDRADPDSQVLEGLITALFALGRLGPAEEQAEKAKAIDGPSPNLTKAVELVRSLGKARDALVAESTPADGLKKAAERYVCAEHLHQTKAPAAAVEAVLKPEKDLPEVAPALALRALLALEKGRLRQAADDIDKAMRLGAKDTRAYCVRGRVRLERGHARSALADLEKAAELSGRTDAAVLHWLAATLAAAGRNADALKTQQEAVKLRPDDPELVEQLRTLESQ